MNLQRLNLSIQAYISSQSPYGNFYWNIQNTRKNTSQHIYTDLLMLENIISVHKQLPKKLVISMDNTATENKNYIYFQWALLLLSLNVFEEIQWIFLPVGHTHFTNDQVFSVFARLISNNISGLKYLKQLFEVCSIF